jgi:protein RecA
MVFCNAGLDESTKRRRATFLGHDAMTRIIRRTELIKVVTPKIKRASLSQIQGVAKALRGVLGSDAVHIGSTSDRGDPRFFVKSQSDDINNLISDGLGWPGGRIIEVYGGEATVKTGFGYDVLAGVQRMGGIAVLLPTEGNIDEWLARRWGVDTDTWLTPDVSTLEEVDATILTTLKRVGKKQLIAFCWDSVAGTTTMAELEESDLKQSRAAQLRAQLVSKMFRRFGGTFPEYNALLFCINQVRDNPDAMFGEKDKPTGGRALPFYATVRVKLTMTGKVTKQRDGKKVCTGFKVKAYTKKNRIRAPFQEVEVLCDFERGIIPVPQAKKGPKTKLQRAAAKKRGR